MNLDKFWALFCQEVAVADCVELSDEDFCEFLLVKTLLDLGNSFRGFVKSEMSFRDFCDFIACQG